MRHILDAKLVKYEVICIDIQPTFATYLQGLTGNRNTPQLHLVYQHDDEDDDKLHLAAYMQNEIASCSTDVSVHEQNKDLIVCLDYQHMQELEDESRLHRLLRRTEKKQKYDRHVSMWDYELMYYERVSGQLVVIAI
jgi:hypothetical protein